jgi:glutamine synthetase
MSHIAGLQKYLPAAMPLLAPDANSYRRLVRHMSAPVDLPLRAARTARQACACPKAAPRRAGSRTGCPGADANPYLVIAASLACGYIGMVNGLEPTNPVGGQRLSSEIRAAALSARCPRRIERVG